MIYIYERLVAASIRDLHTEKLVKQFEHDIRYFKHMDSSLKEARELKHDFTGHLTSMKLLLRDENYSELVKYIEIYLYSVNAIISEIVTGLPSVDVVISVKKAIAQSEGIEFSVVTKNVADIFINPIHPNIIFNNLLDNAIQSCSQLPKEANKKIKMLFMMEYKYLYLKALNSSLPVYFEEGILPETTKFDKELHGLGPETTRQLIVAYEGILYCEYANGEFMFIARLNNTENAEIMRNINRVI